MNIQLAHNGTLIQQNYAGGDFTWYNTTAELMRLKNNGNLGIGTVNPLIHLAIGDSDTGFQQQGDGILAIYTNSGERMRIDNYGNVGIGRSPPTDYALDVYRAGPDNANFAVVRGDGAEIKLKAQDFQSRFTYVGGDLRFDSDDAGTLRMILKSSGKVGIGTDSPSGLLDVKVRPETDYYATYNDMYLGSYLSIGYNRSSNLGYFGYNARLYTSITSGTSAAGISMGGETGNWYKPKYYGNSTATMRIVVPGWNGTISWKHYTHGYSSNQVKDNLFTTDMVLDKNGYLGIGTTSPNFPLQVTGSGGSYVADLYAFHHAGSTTGYSGWHNHNGQNWTAGQSGYPIGLRVDEGIICKRSYIMSDERIKRDIVELEDDEALLQFRQLQPKKYKYIEESRGDSEVYGFIAQEVAEIIPNSVSKEIGYIPSIESFGKISEITEESCIITMEEEHQLQLGELIRCDDSNKKTIEDIEVIEIINSKSIKINRIFTSEESTFKDESQNYEEENVIYIYGKRVDDFHSLNKDSIWTVATAALQEVDRQLQAEKQKVSNLESELALIKSHLGL
jgi:hypothetical protein